MSRFKYIKLSKSKKIRYLTNYYKKNLYIIFLHGFMSDIEGEKPLNFQKFCKKKKLGFLFTKPILNFFTSSLLKDLFFK